MLVLTGELHGSVVIGDTVLSRPMVTITVVEIAGGKVRLGFQAESAVHIHRCAVSQRIHGTRGPECAASTASDESRTAATPGTH